MKWKTLRTTAMIESPHFKVRRDDVRLPSGDEVKGYYVWESPSIATVVPRTADGKFVVVRQWRHAIGAEMLQFPAGAVNPGETPLDAAARELVEETGYVADSYVHLGDTAALPTKATGWHHLYFADGACRTAMPANDPMEEIEVLEVTKVELRGLLLNTEIQVGDSVTAGLLTLQHLGI